jgi:hypothetical protein
MTKPMLIVATVLLLALALAPAAGASVYWTNAGATIGRANGDGTGVNQAFIGAQGCGLAVDAAHVYWTNFDLGTIGRANRDGSGVDQNFIAVVNPSCGLAVDGAHIYFGKLDAAESGNSGSIGRANLDGTGVNQNFITLTDVPVAVAVDPAHVYWANDGNAAAIGRANIDGSAADQNFIPVRLPSGVAVDGAHIYWTSISEGAIGRANLDGTGVNQSFIDAGFFPNAVAVDSAHIYWTNLNPIFQEPADDAIGRANLDGTGRNPSLITGAADPVGLAIDVEQPARLSVDDVAAAEGDAGQTAFRFAVSLDRPESAPVTVDATTGDGTASAANDYRATGGTVTFAPGETAKQVAVQVNGDATVESNETFNLELANAAGNATIADTQGVGTIVNDDHAATAPPATAPPATAPPATIAGGDRKPAPRKFALGTVRLNRKTGTARLAVTVPGPGKLAISTGSAKVGRAATRLIKAAGTVQLPIKASGKQQRTLARTGKVTVRASVTYTPSGGKPTTRSRNVRLEKR